MAGGLFTISNPYSRDDRARLVPFLSSQQAAPTADQQAAIAAGLQMGLLGGTEKQAQTASNVAKAVVQQAQDDPVKWAAQQNANIDQQAQQAQPQTAADAVTQATLQGAAQEQAQAQQAAQGQLPVQRGSLISGLLTNPTPEMVTVPYAQMPQAQQAAGRQQNLTALGRNLANQLIQAKQMYAKAQATGSQQGMDAAHAAALSIRQSAQAAGIDLDAFGANDTVQQAAQNLQDDYYRGIQNALYGSLNETSDDYYNRIYMGLRQRGYNENVSRNEAARRAGIYQAQRMSQLTDALYQYGLSPRGSINQIGTRLLAMMSDENANKAGYYANMFAGPKQDYAFDRQQDTASTQQAYKEKNMATKQTYDLQQMQYKEQLNERLKQLDGQIKMAELSHEYGLKAQLEAEKGQIQARLAQINGANRIAVATINKSGKGKSGSSNGGSGSGGADAMRAIKAYNNWKKNNPDAEDWQNPFQDAYDNAVANLNGNDPSNYDMDDKNQAYSAAQSVLEENARQNYPVTAEGLAQMISNLGGYGPQIAQEWMDDGTLYQYGKNE
ncbi:hypothetical protein [uncultured Mitsuokella sp.]|uniref:hypothetical protein n=1 Tax=uncultured Mitsuokella sp. TaxID=453120 RepID=UPI0026DA97B8|nr:hypothetical protein [uncultured Mitsuokella sp.]